MTGDACRLLERVLENLRDTGVDKDVATFDLLLDVSKYLKRECQRQKAAENIKHALRTLGL